MARPRGVELAAPCSWPATDDLNDLSSGQDYHRHDSSRTFDQLRIVSRRPRNRDAVSGFVLQIGSRILMTNEVSIACTESAPMCGYAYARSVFSHCEACAALRHPTRCVLMYVSAHCLNVIVFAAASRVCSATGVPLANGIGSERLQGAGFRSKFARFGQRDCGVWTETHPAGFATQPVAKEPRRLSGRIGVQV